MSGQVRNDVRYHGFFFQAESTIGRDLEGVARFAVRLGGEHVLEDRAMNRA